MSMSVYSKHFHHCLLFRGASEQSRSTTRQRDWNWATILIELL